ncbi:hypothetical protein SeLEV6574_g05583 [Synchytrium endobioticum]|uniref:Eukaryotic translation initiation factor 5B n=1 Tax=Synchytrium endobioticum TaxID=286115 RepID=A0A507CTK3_9FUNG|nr:hypothetical protein SeLEV6574_g05583 [Synchytrium endobioticum]
MLLVLRSEQRPQPSRTPSPSRREQVAQDRKRAELALKHDDQYYEDLKEFRDTFAALFVCDGATIPELPPDLPPSQFPIVADVDDDSLTLDDRYLYTGFFRVNSRLQPMPSKRPPPLDLEGYKDEVISRAKDYLDDDLMVKVSIPSDYVDPSKRIYVAHRRRSFDPADSVNIESFMRRGMEYASIKALRNTSSRLERNGCRHSPVLLTKVSFQHYLNDRSFTDMAPKKKSAKKPTAKPRCDDDVDITFDDIPIANEAAIEAKSTANEYNVDEDGNDLGGLMALVAKSAGRGKKNKKPRHEDDEEDAAEILAKLEAESNTTHQTSPKPSTPATPQPLPQRDNTEDDQAAAGADIRIKSKKEKEREKKERQKLAKKSEAAVKAASSSPADAKVNITTSTPPAPSLQALADSDSGEEDTTSAAPKKKKKSKKKAAGEKDESKPAPKRKGPAALGALKELLAAKKAAEEEARRQEEEERKRIEDEQRRLEEEERVREEAKRLKKEREKAKIEELKKAGLYLTPAEREKKRQQELKLQQMIAAGHKVAALEEKVEGEAKKRVVYSSKKKQRSAKKEEVPSASPSTPARAEPVEDLDSSKQEEVRELQVKDEADIKRAAIEAAARAAVVAETAWELGGPFQSVVDKGNPNQESWDAESEDEDTSANGGKVSCDAESTEKPELVEVVRAEDGVKPAAAVSSEKSLAETKETNGNKCGTEQGIKENIVITASNPVRKPAPLPEEEADTSEDEESDEDEGEADGETATQKQERLRREQAAARKKQRHEEALAARSKDNLRSPICCILGHVDTGKTKLLDKIRQTNVQEGEAGGITQQIGATYFPLDAIETKTALMRAEGEPSKYKIPGLLIIDTPGHESFTNLRSRGSSLCNIAILVVDIVHGLEPQTIESIGLLKQRKTPFIVALNKIDRMFDWKPMPNYPVRESLKQQPKHAVKEFEDRVRQTQIAFAEQGFNACLYYENPDTRRNVSFVPTSAITGEGIPDLLNLIVEQTQTRLSGALMYLSELECTVLEVKVIEGFGTTIDVILSNGILNEGDKIVLCGLNGPIVTNIRALLTPQPMKELRVKSQYVHHKEIKAAMGVKIAAPDLEKAIAGSRLLVCGPDDDEEELKSDVMEDLTDLYEHIDKSGKGGVCVQASTLGSLEALLVFLKQMAIPVSGINIGPVFKKDIIRAGVMLEKKREYAQLLAFDVPVDRDAQELAEEMGVKIFKADIIYHLFDQFTAFMKEVQEQKKRDDAPAAVFPCHVRMVQGAIFNKRNPIIIGMDVLDGTLRIGTPIVAVDADGQITKLGRVTGIELNHKSREIVKKGEPSVAVKIDGASYETPKMYGRHFTDKDNFYSEVTRQSIDVLKTTFKNDVSPDEWKLVVKLKKILKIV